MGAVSGVNQRAAQALLGHSDPALTANIYTDVNALQLQDEVAKLPWIDAHQDSHQRSQKGPENVCVTGVGRLLSDLAGIAKRLGQLPVAEFSEMVKMAARAGIEPATK